MTIYIFICIVILNVAAYSIYRAFVYVAAAKAEHKATETNKVARAMRLNELSEQIEAFRLASDARFEALRIEHEADMLKLNTDFEADMAELDRREEEDHAKFEEANAVLERRIAECDAIIARNR